jgi:hypothetical protein
MKALAMGPVTAPWQAVEREITAGERNRTRRRSGTPGVRSALKLIGTLHRALCRWSDGRLGGRLRGGPLLLHPVARVDDENGTEPGRVAA